MRLKRLAAIAAATLGVTVPASTALAAPPSGPGTLSPETFNGTATTTCTSSGLTFTATGTATGSYNGTFKESGTVSFTPPVGVITALTATFKIYQGHHVVVTGTKTLSYSNGAICSSTQQLVNAFVNWQAQYKHPRSSSSGQGFLSIGGSDPTNDAFHEDFVLNE